MTSIESNWGLGTAWAVGITIGAATQALLQLLGVMLATAL